MVGRTEGVAHRGFGLGGRFPLSHGPPLLSASPRPQSYKSSILYRQPPVGHDLIVPRAPTPTSVCGGSADLDNHAVRTIRHSYATRHRRDQLRISAIAAGRGGGSEVAQSRTRFDRQAEIQTTRAYHTTDAQVAWTRPSAMRSTRTGRHSSARWRGSRRPTHRPPILMSRSIAGQVGGGRTPLRLAGVVGRPGVAAPLRDQRRRVPLQLVELAFQFAERVGDVGARLFERREVHYQQFVVDHRNILLLRQSGSVRPPPVVGASRDAAMPSVAL